MGTGAALSFAAAFARLPRGDRSFSADEGVVADALDDLGAGEASLDAISLEFSAPTAAAAFFAALGDVLISFGCACFWARRAAG